jgi:reversibly glycosylated polypeptide / UDP-arabinopyranose mutase
MSNFLIVPTIREECIIPFLTAWDQPGLWDGIIVVEDNPENSFKIDQYCGVHHFCWKDIDRDFGHNAWVISRRDGGIKCYGFLKAFEMGADYIFCLDDDCFPLGSPRLFQQKHIHNLENTSRWTESVLGQRTRGIPYKNKGVLDRVVFSHGLWSGVPDFDAIQSLTMGANPYFQPPSGTWVIPKNQYFPYCGMNFAFHQRITPLCYFPFMGINSEFRRFDDIWFGIIAKKICDHLDYQMTSGEPFVDHRRASNVFENLKREAPGIEMNESFWEIIDNISLKGTTPVDCMMEVAAGLSKFDSERAWFCQLGRAIEIWIEAIMQAQDVRCGKKYAL